MKKADYNVLIAGTGVAGLCCALNLPPQYRVLMLSKAAEDESDSFLAQGGICMLQGQEDFAAYIDEITVNNTPTPRIRQNSGTTQDSNLPTSDDKHCYINNANRNGEVLTADGQKLVKFQAPFGKPFAIRMNPENGFTYAGVRVRHGYNLAGDSIVHGTRQFDETFFPASAFKDDVLTLPGSCMDGDVEIEGLFIEIKK